MTGAARRATPADLPHLLRLWALTFPHQTPPDLSAALAEGRAVVVGGPPAPTGAATSGPVTGLPRERRLTVLAQDPDAWARTERAATAGPLADDVDRWHVTVREDAAIAVDGLRLAGYELSSRSWGARLDAADADVDGARRRVEAAAARGLVLRQLGPGDAAAAHQLLHECRPDFPASPATPAPHLDRAQVAQAVAGRGRVAFGVTTPAPAGHRLVAVTLLEVDDDERAADTELTAVAADHRGLGVGTALKALAVVVLVSRGVRTFRTGGAGVNEASLRANRALGYRVEPLWLTWTRPVRPL